MTNDWNFIWTPQFLVGTLIAGLLLNVVSVYVVRAFDRLRKALPASYRRARDEESGRIGQLTTAATSDNALYAALAAEASRLRLPQLLGFFIAFVCAFTLVALVAASQLSPPAQMTTAIRVQAIIGVIVLVSVAVFRYASGLDNGRRARRLDIALRAVQRNRGLPIMD